jgi:hypothetical protein
MGLESYSRRDAIGERAYVRELYQTYYGNRRRVSIDLCGKGECLGCGRRRKLGVRLPGYGYCRKCRRAGAPAKAIDK